MKYLFSAALVVCLVPVTRAADDDNPFKNAKVGDWAEYKMTTATGGFNIEGKIKMEVTAKTDKEATLKTTATVNGMEVPGQETKIDLTKPYDPTSTAGLPKGTEATVKKDGDGKEKIKVGDKEYDTTWQKMKISAKSNGLDFDASTKIWMAKSVPLSGMVKMEMNTKIANMEVKMTMELSGHGSK